MDAIDSVSAIVDLIIDGDVYINVNVIVDIHVGDGVDADVAAGIDGGVIDAVNMSAKKMKNNITYQRINRASIFSSTQSIGTHSSPHCENDPCHR